MAPLTPTTWTPGDAEAAWQVLEEAFAEPAHDDDRAIELATVDAAQFLVVKDEGRVVATGGSFALDMTMPGGRPAPIAGITWISVQATHRRRGLLTAMMTRLLAQASERGERSRRSTPARAPSISASVSARRRGTSRSRSPAAPP